MTLYKIKSWFGIPALALLLTACSGKPQIQEQPNIIWINCEDVSLNWGCYGDDYATTPNIDKLATQGVVFDHAFSSSPICAPSRSTFITGIYSTSLGSQHLRSKVERPAFIRTLPELMSEHGYFTTYGSYKTDFNFDATGMWDYWEIDKAPWRQREDDRPFYSTFVIGMTHEGGSNHSEQWAKSTKDLPADLFHDPAKVSLPPYYPDTPEMRKIWAHYYDNIAVFDREVATILENLEADGLMENTIIFVFSDHGAGLPRYKRWLYDTGIHIPLVVYVPDKFKHLINSEIGGRSAQIVNFADFAPTMLSLAGASIPEYEEGRAFMGKQAAAPRKFTVGTRSRADNMYEMSLAIRTDHYIYIRHYYPHLPYMQPGRIFSSSKESFAEFHRLKAEGRLNALQQKMYEPKGVEELYDLREDPDELNDLSREEAYTDLLLSFREQLQQWAIEHRSTDFMHEAEYMRRSEGATPYEFAHSDQYPIEKLVAAAEMVGRATLDECLPLLKDESPGVRYWGVIAIQALGDEGAGAVNGLIEVLDDESPSVEIAAAETLCYLGETEVALPVLGRNLQDERPWVALYAARSVELIEEKAEPLVPVMLKVLEANKKKPGEESPHPIYKDYNFAAFTGWSLEYALEYCGRPVKE